MITVFLIAVTLALDAFAVSVSSGISVEGFSWRQALQLGLWFGLFQFAMPLIGGFLGDAMRVYIQRIDHFVAFGLLALIGGGMVRSALSKGTASAKAAPTVLSVPRLATLATATSIDALAVGVSMAFMELNLLLSAIVIGVVAFVLSVAGGLLGRKLGSLFQKRAELVGGLVLIGIGTKILIEHLIG